MKWKCLQHLCWLAMSLYLMPTTTNADDVVPKHPTVHLRAWGVPSPYALGVSAEADRRVLLAFRQAFPWVELESPTGLVIPGGGRTMDMVPMMQIAGDIAPDVLYVNFRYSHGYITKKLLYPLDRQIEEMAGARIIDGSAMALPEYLLELRKGANFERVDQRVPAQCWDVMRRECPHGVNCPYRREWGLPPLERHWHIWTFPVGPIVMGLQYDRTMFAEHADEGIEMRAPRDWEEMLAWAKVLTRPDRNEYGLRLSTDVPGWEFLSFLYAAGGEAVSRDEQGKWTCRLDSEAAAQAAYFYARLRLEPVHRGDRLYRGVTMTEAAVAGTTRFGMVLQPMDDRFMVDPNNLNRTFGPMPTGPSGLRRSEFNAKMVGLFSGLANDPQRRQAAWEYIRFYDGVAARRIRTQTMVEAGLGTFVRPAVLQQFNEDGKYDSLIRQIPPDVTETYSTAFAGGVPEPYGENCQRIYDELNKPLGTILHDPLVVRAIDSGRPDLAMPTIRQILKDATTKINEKLLGNVPAEIQAQRETTAWIVVSLVVLIFVWMVYHVIRTFRPPQREEGYARPALRRYRWAYALLLPALMSIALWSYWPLAGGTAIAFQNYSITGNSVWIGAANFANVLYDAEFWYAMRVSLVYAVMYMVFGFGAPIALALLLQETPVGSVLFRTLYYLPAVLSGAMVIFLWKSFYGPDGLVNQVLNSLIYVVNVLPGVELNSLRENWLDNPTFALFFCLLPTVWAGVGPGCLLYLAALKTIPDEMYEAADIDGAGIRRKVFSIALPAIKALVMINFVGAMIGAVRGAGGFVLAMTGGGPYGQQGGATEVIGLKLFYTSFGQLEFGRASAMAWILGSMLIGFTVFQLQRLENLEFKTAEKVK